MFRKDNSGSFASRGGLLTACALWAAVSVGCGDEAVSEVPVAIATGGTAAPVTALPSAGTVVSQGAAGAAAEMGTVVVDTSGLGGSPEEAESSYCEAKALLDQKCNSCHTTGQIGPVQLDSYDALHAAGFSDPSKPVYELMMERVQDATRPMPPIPAEPLTAAEVAVLQKWVDEGRPSSDTCAAAPAPAPTGDGSYDKKDPNTWSCAGDTYTFLAHGAPNASDTTPYDASSVGANGDPNYYQCFYYKVPWQPGQQGIYFKPIIDNSRVLHHWLLYASESAVGLSDGGMLGNCAVQSDPNRVLLAGWAPGGLAQHMPDDVGLEMPAGGSAFITLEVHYYNSQPGQPAADRSGVEICLTEPGETRTNIAAPHWLGTELGINVPVGATTDAVGMCTPNQGQTATLISVSPHMHQIGIHSKMELLRADGSVEVFLDKPFDFENQVDYAFEPPVVVSPGDRVRTTCTFRNTYSSSVSFGEGTNDEMCYLFTNAYPAGSLHNGGNGCLGPLCFPGGVNRCID